MSILHFVGKAFGLPFMTVVSYGGPVESICQISQVAKKSNLGCCLRTTI